MRFPSTQGFLEESRRYALCFTCEGCAHFDPTSTGCVHGYPVDDHLQENQGKAELVFCKDFELA